MLILHQHFYDLLLILCREVLCSYQLLSFFTWLLGLFTSDIFLNLLDTVQENVWKFVLTLVPLGLLSIHLLVILPQGLVDNSHLRDLLLKFVNLIFELEVLLIDSFEIIEVELGHLLFVIGFFLDRAVQIRLHHNFSSRVKVSFDGFNRWRLLLRYVQKPELFILVQQVHADLLKLCQLLVRRIMLLLIAI